MVENTIKNQQRITEFDDKKFKKMTQKIEHKPIKISKRIR